MQTLLHAPHCDTPVKRHRRRRRGALAVIHTSAAIHRGYAITVVLDRLEPTDPWSIRARIAAALSPARCLATLDVERPRTRATARARAIALREATLLIDRVEDTCYGMWPAAGHAITAG